MNKGNVRHMVNAALMTAVICVLTAAVHIPSGHGYIHLGDAAIYLAAALLPLPYAVGAAALGGAMADLIAGYAQYCLPTMVIKGALALVCFTIGGERMFCVRRIMSCVVCCLITVVGYWLTDVILYQGDLLAQLFVTLPGNLVQSTASALVYCACAVAMDHFHVHIPK
ncbi:MAG: TIGR04002 family protein [Oscillospiraceae bacterium]|nr:TIGR04002 family protein [Oscillospiraceae bacterium]